jgi:hypothetical protein
VPQSYLTTHFSISICSCEKLGNTSIARFGCKKDIVPSAPPS